MLKFLVDTQLPPKLSKYLTKKGMWFENLTGFKEKNPEQVRSNLEIRSRTIRSLVNGAAYHIGKLEVPTLAALRKQTPHLESYHNKIKVSEAVGDIQDFHKDSTHKGALFQAASQFNLLEMAGPNVTPEQGVAIYENDHTQGPACAIACGAGTIFRNYFVQVNDQVGQSANNQIDCLKDIGIALKNEELNLWQMQNGYALASIDGLKNISQQIKAKSRKAYDDLKSITR
ncbi:MAG: hypothetical protein DHS20C18_42750 [Saprospiraceae bacterium]|nr:MAG: hypothetical protein DHS20C18_42750 [Saprospiraceae bacterium]